MVTCTTFLSVFVLTVLNTGYVYCEKCPGTGEVCLENFECCKTGCCKISYKPTTILTVPELIGVIVSVLVVAGITVVIVLCICAKCRKARKEAKKEAASRPPEYVYPPPKSPSVYYSETSEYGPRTNPYHANREWQDRRAWSMTS